MVITNQAGSGLDFFLGIGDTAALIARQARAGHKVLFIGNGASAAISSHMAADFWKTGGMKTLAFNDGVLLTCMGNDYGYEQVFAKPLPQCLQPVFQTENNGN